MANIVSYNLGDLTEDAARAKGEVVLQVLEGLPSGTGEGSR